MRSTFHLSRCTCHVPRANVKNGMMPTRTIVGVSHGYRRAFWLRGWGAAVVDSPRTRVRRKRLVFRRKKEDRKEDNMMPIGQSRVCVTRPDPGFTPAPTHWHQGVCYTWQTRRESTPTHTNTHDSQMFHSIAKSSPRHKHSLHSYHKPDRTQFPQSQISRLKRCAITIHHLQLFGCFPPRQ